MAKVKPELDSPWDSMPVLQEAMLRLIQTCIAQGIREPHRFVSDDNILELYQEAYRETIKRRMKRNSEDG